jgi:hypothetical protein
VNLAAKLKTLAVKVNPPRQSREYWLASTNVGAASGYRINIQGIGRSVKDSVADRRRYAKNFAKIQGLCKGCEHYDANSKAVGGHCRLKEQENCVR